MTSVDWPDLTGKTILQIIPDLSAGGAERTTIEMTEAIRKAGGRALVASRGGRLESDLRQAGGELLRLNVASKNPFVLRANMRQLIDHIHQDGIDLLHARSRAPGWSALWAAEATGIPFVTTYHGAYSGTAGLKRRYNSVMARGDVVIANSDWTANHVHTVHDLPRDSIVTIPRGVDFETFDPKAVSAERRAALRESWGIAPTETRLLLVLPGRLTSWKGQMTALEALALLEPSERQNLRLILAGDDQGRSGYVAELNEFIVNEHLAECVSIVGHTEDMAAAYSLADIVLAPSTRPEAFGRVAAEASAMAKPVIVSDHGGQRETVIEGQSGARAEPGSARSLSACIRTMMQLPAPARTTMGEVGQAHIRENFSKQKLQQATLQVYATLFDRTASVENLPK